MAPKNIMANLRTEGYCLNIRSAAVFQRNDEILLFYFPKPGIYSLPGGRCNLGEDSRTAIIRECHEELLAVVEPQRLLWIAENFFEFNGEMTHELLFIYLVKPVSGFDILGSDEFMGHEGEKLMPCKWVKGSKLGEYPLFPKFLIKALTKLPLQTEHIIHYDDKN